MLFKFKGRKTGSIGICYWMECIADSELALYDNYEHISELYYWDVDLGIWVKYHV